MAVKLKTKYYVYFHMVTGKPTPKKVEDEIADKLETLMNDYEIINIQAFLNPFAKGMSIITTDDNGKPMDTPGPGS